MGEEYSTQKSKTLRVKIRKKDIYHSKAQWRQFITQKSLKPRPPLNESQVVVSSI
jgi:hypothetical protein